MLITIFVLWSISIIAHILFQKGILKPHHDIAYVFRYKKDQIKPFSFADMLVTEGVNVNDAQIINAEEAEDEGQKSSFCDEKIVNGNCAEKDEEEMELVMKRSNGKHHHHHQDAVKMWKNIKHNFIWISKNKPTSSELKNKRY